MLITSRTALSQSGDDDSSIGWPVGKTSGFDSSGSVSRGFVEISNRANLFIFANQSRALLLILSRNRRRCRRSLCPGTDDCVSGKLGEHLAEAELGPGWHMMLNCRTGAAWQALLRLQAGSPKTWQADVIRQGFVTIGECKQLRAMFGEGGGGGGVGLYNITQEESNSGGLTILLSQFTDILNYVSFETFHNKTSHHPLSLHNVNCSPFFFFLTIPHNHHPSPFNPLH